MVIVGFGVIRGCQCYGTGGSMGGSGSTVDAKLREPDGVCIWCVRGWEPWQPTSTYRRAALLASC